MDIIIRDLINHGINKTSKILKITIINKEVGIINGLANNLINKTLGIGANQIINEYRYKTYDNLIKYIKNNSIYILV